MSGAAAGAVAWTAPVIESFTSKAGAVSGNLLFFDNFTEEVTQGVPCGACTLNYAVAGGAQGLHNWTCTAGSIDLISDCCGYTDTGYAGPYLDMDGSTDASGTIQTKTSFSLAAGVTYTLTVVLAGDYRGGSGTVEISLAGATDTVTLSSNTPFAPYTLTVTPGSATSSPIVIASEDGASNVGLLLQSVQLSS
jgi:hypothetical protein